MQGSCATVVHDLCPGEARLRVARREAEDAYLLQCCQCLAAEAKGGARMHVCQRGSFARVMETACRLKINMPQASSVIVDSDGVVRQVNLRSGSETEPCDEKGNSCQASTGTWQVGVSSKWRRRRSKQQYVPASARLFSKRNRAVLG